MMDSSTFKRFTASIENILDNLEDMDFTAFGKTILQDFFTYSFMSSFFPRFYRKYSHNVYYQET
jgi:hypothetical protein